MRPMVQKREHKEEIDEEDRLTYEALLSAERAFKNYVEERGYDSIYWDIEFSVYQLSSDLKTRLKKFSIESEPRKANNEVRLYKELV